MMTQPSAPAWRRSSLCNESACVEVASDSGRQVVMMRDAKQPSYASPMLVFSAQRFAEFVGGVRLGEFD
jgi:hypothetical protein